MHIKGKGAREKRKDNVRCRRHKGIGGERRRKDEAGRQEREDRVEGSRRKKQGGEAAIWRRREGGRAEDTAAMKPVICQISHGHAHIHITSQNRERTMSNNIGGSQPQKQHI